MVKLGSKLARTYAARRLVEFDYSDSSHAFFVTIRARPDGPHDPFLDPQLAQAVVDSLLWLRQERDISIYAYCLMPDHLHLLLRLPKAARSLGDIIASMKKYTTRRSWDLGYTGPLWQDRFHDHILRKNDNAPAVIQYILDNPIRKGLTVDWESFPWHGMPDQL